MGPTSIRREEMGRGRWPGKLSHPISFQLPIFKLRVIRELVPATLCKFGPLISVHLLMAPVRLTPQSVKAWRIRSMRSIGVRRTRTVTRITRRNFIGNIFETGMNTPEPQKTATARLEGNND